MSSVDDVGTLINQFIAAAASEGDYAVFASELATLISGRTTSLLQFIQALGPSLTSDDIATRTHSVHCLSATLGGMVNSPGVPKQDVNVLLLFLVSKLTDEKLTLHILTALTSLVQLRSFLPNVQDNLVTLLNSISTNYEPRKHLAKVRYEGFHLLETLFTKHQDGIVSIPNNSNLFVSTFVHIAGGEKDPRNLLTSFKLNTLINEKINFDNRTENKTHDQLLSDLFDVSFCYFPISFKPPANDPYKITASDLKIQLRNTIASQSQFAQDTFPSLFEKLTSTNPAVRNDVLQCLYQCIVSYESATIEQYWVTIWDALKFEILHNDVLIFKPESDEIVPPNAESIDDSDENKTLIFTLMSLSAMVTKLESTDSFNSMISTVIDGLKPNFKSLGAKTLKQSVLLLCLMGSTSVEFFNQVVGFIFSFEIWGKYIRSDVQEAQFQDEDEVDVSLTVARQRDLIDNLGFIFSASKILGKPTNLNDYKDHLLIFMGQLLNASSNLEKTLKCKLTQQLTKLVLLDDFLTQEEVTLVLGWLTENMSSIIANDNPNWPSDMLMQEITKSLVHIMSNTSDDSALSNVSTVIEIVLPTLLEKVSEKEVLNLINKLCVNYQFLEVLSIRFLNRLAYDDYDPQAFGNIVECLIQCFIQTQKVNQFLTNSWYQNFLPRFLSVVLKKAPEDFMILELSGQLLGLIVKFIHHSKHQAILNELVPFFLEGAAFEGNQIESVIQTPAAKITLFKHLISKIDKRTEFPTLTNIVLQKFVDVISSLSIDLLRIEYLQTLAVLANKFTKKDGELMEDLLARLFEEGKTDVNSFETAIWITKGLIVKMDPVGFQYYDLIIDWLFLSEDIQFCKTVSLSFSILMGDLAIFLNEENIKGKLISGVLNLNVALLYKQQLFERLLPKLIENFAGTDVEARREVYLSTLAVIIKNVSTNILRPHLETVLPLALTGLSFQNTSILEASLQTFEVIIQKSPALILENLGSLVKKLIDLSTTRIVSNKQLVNNEQIRLLSLTCLKGVFSELPLTKVVKYQNSTRNLLAKGLDDKKRSVRKQTTDVRQLLYELGR